MKSLLRFVSVSMSNCQCQYVKMLHIIQYQSKYVKHSVCHSVSAVCQIVSQNISNCQCEWVCQNINVSVSNCHCVPVSQCLSAPVSVCQIVKEREKTAAAAGSCQVLSLPVGNWESLEAAILHTFCLFSIALATFQWQIILKTTYIFIENWKKDDLWNMDPHHFTRFIMHSTSQSCTWVLASVFVFFLNLVICKL